MADHSSFKHRELKQSEAAFSNRPSGLPFDVVVELDHIAKEEKAHTSYAEIDDVRVARRRQRQTGSR